MQGYLLVRAGGSNYGLLLEQVVEVIDGFGVDPAPSVHAAVRGVARMRGQLVPLVHLASLIGDSAPPDEVGITAVLTDCFGSLVALEVDDADAVLTEEPDPVPEAWRLPWAIGVGRVNGAIVPVIDIELLAERLLAFGVGEER